VAKNTTHEVDDSPVFWLAVYQKAVAHNDTERAAEARTELARLGVTVAPRTQANATPPKRKRGKGGARE
jgi:hypothetical protein